MSTADEAAGLAPARMHEMLAEHHKAAFAWAVTCCRNNRLQAEEVLQITYWKILTGRARYDGRASFKTWLFSVVRFTAAEEWRRWLLRHLGALPISSALPVADPAPQPAEIVSSRQIESIVRHALTTLPERQRQVLHLMFCENMTIREAAEVMGVSSGSAARHYDRAKTTLKRTLADMGVSQ